MGASGGAVVAPITLLWLKKGGRSGANGPERQPASIPGPKSSPGAVAGAAKRGLARISSRSLFIRPHAFFVVVSDDKAPTARLDPKLSMGRGSALEGGVD